MENCDKNITNVDEDAMLSWVPWFLVLIFVPLITGSGIFWNSAFIFVVYRVKSMRTITNIFLVNLAIADSSLLVVASSQYIVSYVNAPSYRDGFSLYSVAGCTLSNFLVYLCYYASVWTITLVSIERYLAVCRPIWYNNIKNNRRAIPLICTAWVVSLLFASFTTPYMTVLDYCVISRDDNSIVERKPTCRRHCKWCDATIYSTDLLYFLISLLTNIISFGFIVRNLKAKLLMKQSNHVRDSVAKMLIINGIVFFVCLTPFSFLNVVNLCETFEVILFSEPTITLLSWISRVFFLFNSAINPIVYNVTNSMYRAAFKQTFNFRRKLAGITKCDEDFNNESSP